MRSSGVGAAAAGLAKAAAQCPILGALRAYVDEEVRKMISWLAGMSGLLLLLTGGATEALIDATRQPNNPVVGPVHSRPIGGLQLDVEPRRAQVFVDGAYAGVVGDFRGYYNHLALPAGLHRIEVLTPGFLPLIFEVMVVPDRTVTYRWSLQEAPGE